MASWKWEVKEDIKEQFDKADEYCVKHPRQPSDYRHPGAVYTSRFIPSIRYTPDGDYLDDDEWEKDVVSFVLISVVEEPPLSYHHNQRLLPWSVVFESFKT